MTENEIENILRSALTHDDIRMRMSDIMQSNQERTPNYKLNSEELEVHCAINIIADCIEAANIREDSFEPYLELMTLFSNVSDEVTKTDNQDEFEKYVNENAVLFPKGANPEAVYTRNVGIVHDAMIILLLFDYIDTATAADIMTALGRDTYKNTMLTKDFCEAQP